MNNLEIKIEDFYSVEKEVARIDFMSLNVFLYYQGIEKLMPDDFVKIILNNKDRSKIKRIIWIGFNGLDINTISSSILWNLWPNLKVWHIYNYNGALLFDGADNYISKVNSDNKVFYNIPHDILENSVVTFYDFGYGRDGSVALNSCL